MSTVILPLTVIAIPIAEVLFSAFSRLRDERERIAALWLQSIRFLAAVILPVLVGLVVVAPDLIPAAFGAHWHVSVGIIQILSIYVIIRSLQSWSSVRHGRRRKAAGHALDAARGSLPDARSASSSAHDGVSRRWRSASSSASWSRSRFRC